MNLVIIKANLKICFYTIVNDQRGQEYRTNNIMPKNEPVKLVYPTSQTTSSTAATIVMNNNRATFSSAPVQNGTVTLSTMTANSLTQNQQQQATAGIFSQD